MKEFLMARVVPSQIVEFIHQMGDPNSPLVVNHGTASSLTALARLIDEIPTELLTISGSDYSDLVCGVEAIRNAIAFWQHTGNHQVGIPQIRGKQIPAILREALAKCPDQIPAPATTELAFISDGVLRDSIRLDISTATSALHNGEWKAATVLAGAAAEALLLWAVSKSPDVSNSPKNRKGHPENWDLAEYIIAAESLNLIKPNTVNQTNSAKNFRNLIHPGRAQRLGEDCDRATALTAVAAVECIVRDLS